MSAFVLALASFTQPARAAAAAARLPARSSAVRAAAKHMLFRVRGTKGATVYLLGSVHLLTAEAGKLPPEVDAAFADSKKLVFETSLDTIQLRAQEMIGRAQFKNGATLRSSLSPAAVPKVDSILHLYGLSIDQLNPFKPWFVSLAMTQMALQKANFAAQYGVDMQLNARAKAENKPVGSLETVDFQLGLFDMLTPGDQEMMLTSAKGPDATAADLAKIKDAWVAGDTGALEKIMLESGDETPGMVETVLTKRNQNWVPQIDAMLQGSDNTLVVVGAAHLLGKEGVLEMLKAKGYKVEQL